MAYQTHPWWHNNALRGIVLPCMWWWAPSLWRWCGWRRLGTARPPSLRCGRPSASWTTFRGLVLPFGNSVCSWLCFPERVWPGIQMWFLKEQSWGVTVPADKAVDGRLDCIYFSLLLTLRIWARLHTWQGFWFSPCCLPRSKVIRHYRCGGEIWNAVYITCCVYHILYVFFPLDKEIIVYLRFFVLFCLSLVWCTENWSGHILKLSPRSRYIYLNLCSNVLRRDFKLEFKMFLWKNSKLCKQNGFWVVVDEVVHKERLPDLCVAGQEGIAHSTLQPSVVQIALLDVRLRKHNGKRIRTSWLQRTCLKAAYFNHQGTI